MNNLANHIFKNNISYKNHRHQVIIFTGSVSDHNSAGGVGELLTFRQPGKLWLRVPQAGRRSGQRMRDSWVAHLTFGQGGLRGLPGSRKVNIVLCVGIEGAVFWRRESPLNRSSTTYRRRSRRGTNPDEHCRAFCRFALQRRAPCPQKANRTGA